ncbi:MAG TPA: hypothetical protein VE545_10235 [Candidatus Dormibacteraeota bacterium]|nr:hypothetical protein [Candidatus Dormibacteraeota bacterium]
MKRIFSSPIVALAVGLCLRLLFVLKFPANSGDTVLYEQMATNWLQHHVYGMNVNGAVVPVDLRMPGYPAFLALIYVITGKTAASARLFVMVAQAAIDLAGCLMIAGLGVALAAIADVRRRTRDVFLATVWLAALCPFVGNYSATLLTEVIAVFWTAVALFLLVMTASCDQEGLTVANEKWGWKLSYRAAALLAGLAVGIGTLFRPETPLLLIAAWIAYALAWWPEERKREWFRVVILSGIACVLPLLPWALRNAVTLHEVQFLAPKNSNLPGELVPYGFMAWEKTWLFRVSDCYQVSWKLNDDVIDIDTIPARAFDSAEEKVRVAAILEQYNNDLTLTADEDAAFGQLARERTARHPLRRYLLIPVARMFTLWFTPRIELIPVSGTVFPLKQSWQDDKADQSVTILFFVLNIFNVALGMWGSWRLWRWSPAVRPALMVLGVFVLLRTAFLTTVETPEPRYVLECFPAVIALGATVFGGRRRDAVA